MKIVVIGGNAAGMSVALKAKRECKTAEVIVITKENQISFAPGALSFYLKGAIEDEALYARTPDSVRAAGIELYLQSPVIEVDTVLKSVTFLPHNQAQKGEKKTLTYDRLMIATGARPQDHPLKLKHYHNVYTFKSFFEVDRLKKARAEYKTMAVIGGSIVAVEVAQTLSSMGIKTYLIHRGAYPLDRYFGASEKERILESLDAQGIECIMGATIEAIKAGQLNPSTLTSLLIHQEQDTRWIDIDGAVLALGVAPNSELFGSLDGDGLETTANGAIEIDLYGETSLQDHYAAGDVATIPHFLLGSRYLPVAASANKMGRIIGQNIVSNRSDRVPYLGSLGSAMVRLGEWELGATGITEREARLANIPYQMATITAPSAAEFIEHQHPVTITLLYHAKTRVLLGGTIIAKGNASLRLTALTALIYGKQTVDAIGFMDFAYEPSLSAMWDPLNIAGNRA